ncbi:MAG TPA: plastocyanin/azurin family copper-binding protein [Herpetosiphonaceae bacterium]|nr:plastocyanin/azurin family copper-binding protein [Herpetosiphonaceae bacterium]
MKILTRAARGALLGLGLLALAACGESAATAPPQPTGDTQGVSVAQATVAPLPTLAATPTIALAPTATVNMAAPPAVSGTTVEAQAKLFAFAPARLEVTAGTTVRWTNEDDIEHSVTSGAPPEGDTVFDSGFFTKGQSYSYTFADPGTYAYFCQRHNSMLGTVVVK